MTEHSIACRRERQESEKRRQDWIKKWPNYCKKCDAVGVHEESQNHPYGSTTATETWTEPCECLNNGECPRCGQAVMTDDVKPCSNCEWNWGDGPEDYCPPLWECWGDCIYEEEENQISKKSKE